jgi:hypothetical protein
LEDLGIDRRLLLRWMLKEYGGKLWIGFLCHIVVIFCEYDDEPSGSIKFSFSGRVVTWILFVYWLVSWIPSFLCH